jgi:hypothetical protein
MEADMSFDLQDPRIARQELLEAVISGMGGAVCAPMPGTLLEMMEIAAMERRPTGDLISDQAELASPPLTSPQIGSRMTLWFTTWREALSNAANGCRAMLGVRRVPV